MEEYNTEEYWEYVESILDRSGEHTAKALLLALADSDVVLTGAAIEKVADYISNKHIEIVKDSLDRLKDAGVELGRPRGNSDRVLKAVKMYTKGGKSMREVEKLTGVSRSSISKVLKKLREE